MLRPWPALPDLLSKLTAMSTTPAATSSTLAQRCAPIAAPDKNPAGETDVTMPWKSPAEAQGEHARATGFRHRQPPDHRRRLCALTRVLALGVLVGGGLWGFLLSLGLISEAAGLWGVAVGVAVAPITVVATPLYALFASGDWTPLALNYGGSVASALLFYLGAALASD